MIKSALKETIAPAHQLAELLAAKLDSNAGGTDDGIYFEWKSTMTAVQLLDLARDKDAFVAITDGWVVIIEATSREEANAKVLRDLELLTKEVTEHVYIEQTNPTEPEGPKQVVAFKGYGIYANYDAEAPDTEILILVATKELAKKVCEVLNEDPREWNQLAYVEGCEHCKSFKYTTAYSENEADFSKTLEEALPNECEDDED